MPHLCTTLCKQHKEVLEWNEEVDDNEVVDDRVAMSTLYNCLWRAPSLATGTGGEARVYARTMEWTNEKILLFIQAIETHPVLWDTAKESPVPRYLSVIASLIETETLFRKLVSCFAIKGPIAFIRNSKSSQDILEKFLKPLRGYIFNSSKNRSVSSSRLFKKGLTQHLGLALLFSTNCKPRYKLQRTTQPLLVDPCS